MAGAASGFFPSAGAAGTMTAVAAEIELTQDGEAFQRKRAQNISSILAGVKGEWIKIVLEVVANELVRIYENQINFLESDSVRVMAQCAALTAISYLKDADAGKNPFNRNDVLKAVVTCNTKHDYRSYSPLITTNKSLWNVCEVFTKPLLMQEDVLILEINSQEKTQNIEDYGYRRKVLSYGDGQYESFDGLDNRLNSKPIKGKYFEKISNYNFLLCNLGNLTDYQNHLSLEGAKLSFKEFIRSRIPFEIANPCRLVRKLPL